VLVFVFVFVDCMTNVEMLLGAQQRGRRLCANSWWWKDGVTLVQLIHADYITGLSHELIALEGGVNLDR